MRKLYYFIATLLVLIGLSQCRKPVFPDYGGGGKQTISFTTSDDSSKGDLFQEAGSYQKLKYKWAAGDLIYVYASVNGDFSDGVYCGKLSLKSESVGSTSGRFEGDVEMPSGMKKEESMVRFYHFGSGISVNDGVATVNFETQDGSLSTVSSKIVGVVDMVYSGSNKYDDAKLKTKFAIAKLDLQNFGENVIVKAVNDVTNTVIEVSDKGVLGYSGNTTMTFTYNAGDYYYFVFVPDVPSSGSKTGEKEYTLESASKTAKIGMNVSSCAFCTSNGDVVKIKPLYKSWLPGKFSISSTKQVQFSRGNLQYLGKGASGTLTPSWRFAEHQYDYFGNGGTNSGNATVNGYFDYNFVAGENAARDLFGWGCTGNKDNRSNTGQIYYMPYNTEVSSSQISNLNYFGYGPDLENTTTMRNLTVENLSDWGCISELPGNTSTDKIWFTLSTTDWVYMLGTNSPNRGGNMYAKACVSWTSGGNTITTNGLIILPDGWTDQPSPYNLNSYNDKAVDYTTNTLTLEKWEHLESLGAVFLPAAERRDGTNQDGIGSGTYYTSKAAHPEDKDYHIYSYSMLFSSNSVTHGSYRGRCIGNAVRLVTEVKSNGNGTAEGFGGGTW